MAAHHVGAPGIARTPESMQFAPATQQTSPDLAGGFAPTDVDLVTGLALWCELVSDLRRAAELRQIARRIRIARRTPLPWVTWTLLDAGRVGAAAVRAARDPDSGITVERVRPLTRRLTVLATGEAFEIVRVIPAEG